MRSVRRCTLWAAAVFGGIGGACAVALLALCSAVLFAPPAAVWLFVVGSSAVAAAAGGGASWAMLVRPAARPGAWIGVAAGLAGAMLGYIIHACIVILAKTAVHVFGPHDPVKEQGSPEFFGMLFGYPLSAVVFVPAALVTGVALVWAGRRRTPD
jgi:hypothetical protein